MTNIRTLTPGAATVHVETCQFPERSHFLRKCKGCQTRWFKGPFWRFECDKCNTDWYMKYDRKAELDRQRHYKAKKRLTNSV